MEGWSSGARLVVPGGPSGERISSVWNSPSTCRPWNGDEGQSLARLAGAVDAARDGFAAVSANDHFLFQAPWLDGPTALAAVIERSGAMELATTVALVALRGPVPLAKPSSRWISCPMAG